MKTCVYRVCVAVVILNAFAITTKGRTLKNIDFDWKFISGDIQSAQDSNFNDSSWRSLDVPHDWSIEGPYDPNNTPHNAYLPVGIAWYRKTIDVSEQWLEQKVYIQFEGVYMDSDVWVNGVHVGNRPYGWISFQYDITKHLKTGSNLIAVRVNNSPAPTARYYHGSGIYGHVNLLVMSKLHIPPRGGVFVRCHNVDQHQATIDITTEMNNETTNKMLATIVQRLTDDSGVVVAETESEPIDLKPGQLITKDQVLTVQSPNLWSPSNPYLYQLETQIKTSKRVIDRIITPYGIRSIRFEAETGFWLNDQNIKLKGVANHPEVMPVGAAIPEALMQWKLTLLKSMGCNAIRTAHNPRTPTFFKLCDRLGIMVMDEIFDGWQGKRANDYGKRFFKDWWKQDVRDWVRRDRNHACVIMWSIGNETGKTDKYNITDYIHQFDDDTRPTTGGTIFDGVDVSGFNGPGGVPGVIEAFHQANPQKPVIITEEPHTLQTRGFYRVPTWWRSIRGNVHHFPPYGTKQIFFGGHPRYKSSYDNAGVRMSARTSWKRTSTIPWLSGEFRWTGFDSLGCSFFMGAEFPKRSYNGGIIDFAGFPKDHYYFYQSQWSDEPMVHILPHWTHPNLPIKTIVPVVVYSNCQEVELFLNKKSLGKQKVSDLLEFVWQVPYEPGELKAIAYNEGQVIKETAFHTAGYPVKLKLQTSNAQLKTDKRDISLVTISAHDQDRHFVPWSHDLVEFDISGPVKLLGFENGDPMDGMTHRIGKRHLFYGLARGFFQATDQDGPIEITAGAILGDRLFQDKTQVAMDIQQIAIRGKIEPQDLEIRYTKDGSTPTKRSMLYKNPFFIERDTLVNALVLRNGKSILSLTAEFKKGPELQFDDPHLVVKEDTQDQTDSLAFSGPFDKELHGPWKEGSTLFTFKADGTVVRTLNDKQTLEAYWWYDFPADLFENPDAVGSGELLWINSKQISKLKLSYQTADKLLVQTPEKKQNAISERVFV